MEHHQIEAELQRFKLWDYCTSIRLNKDGGSRAILNLKQLNERYVDHIHFKMETLRSAVDAMRLWCFFGFVDLADVYYSILLKIFDRHFFHFYFDGIKYKFTSLIIGQRVFTNIMKPVFAT